MKRKLLLLFVFVTISSFSQISNLAELASGKLMRFSSIKEADGKMYGYILISGLGEVNKTHQKYEYVILDKNLNKVSNGEFLEKDYRGLTTRFLSPDKIGDKLLFTVAHHGVGSYYSMYNTFRVLDIAKNEMSEPFYFNEEKVFVNGERPNKKFFKSIRKSKVVYPIKTGSGFLLHEVSRVKNSQTIRMYDTEKNKKWEYISNKDKVKGYKANEIIDDKNILFSFTNNETKSVVIHSLNPETGEEIFQYELENENSKANHLFRMEDLGDRYVIIGKMSPYHKRGYDTEKALGVFRIELDKKGKELSKKYFFWNQTSQFIKMNKDGETEDGFKLVAKNFFVFKNGSISILTEKRKERKGLLAVGYKTADFVIMNYDKDFNLVGVDTIEKDVSKWSYSDYLYSQDVKDGNGVVFFYNDYKEAEGDSKKKNWILGIVSIIDGKMTHEQIPMSSEEFFILPYIAKEGYILLREINKDSDYDQIRLEKLNY